MRFVPAAANFMEQGSYNDDQACWMRDASPTAQQQRDAERAASWLIGGKR
jgi:hypothetical protein